MAEVEIRTFIAHPHVRIDAGVLGGSPYVAGSRVLVRRLWAFYQAGATVEQIFRRFPHLSKAKVLDALAFAFDNIELIEADVAREAEAIKSAEQKCR